ncbi:MAG: Crp/Fnr family transcriptional regulator [Betaproteobacteria bacterium]|nr:Crp/Fnr family transcriptional regulator [Betaproteobacteria bacterium]
MSPANPRANRLLAALPEAAYRRLLPDLEASSLRVGETLFRRSGRLQHAYFPTSSIVTLSYAIEEDGAMAKAWPVGREGVVGISLFLGSPKRDNRADVQISGVAFRLPASALRAEFKRAGTFQHLLLRYVFALVTQASQLGVCSHYHSIEQRFCRFLSLLFDRVRADHVVITQARIAELLGVRRVSISNAAAHLHAAGVIEYRRGNIQLVSRTRLEARACPCAAIIRRAFASVTK